MVFNYYSSERNIYRRKSALNLNGSGATTRDLPTATKRQLVLGELALDPLSRQGPNTIRHNIRHRAGIHLTRYVLININSPTSESVTERRFRDAAKDEMKLHDTEGFSHRAPTAKKVETTHFYRTPP